jgi:hypothetical protein
MPAEKSVTQALVDYVREAEEAVLAEHPEAHGAYQGLKNLAGWLESLEAPEAEPEPAPSPEPLAPEADVPLGAEEA